MTATIGAAPSLPTVDYTDALRRSAIVLRAELDLDASLNTMTSAIASASPWLFSWITAVDFANGFTEIVGRAEQVLTRTRGTRSHWPLRHGPAQDALNANGHLLIRNAQESDYPAYKEDAVVRGFHTGLLVPIPETDLQGRPLVLCCQSPEEYEPTSEDFAFLDTMVVMVAIAVSNFKKAHSEGNQSGLVGAAAAVIARSLDAILSGASPDDVARDAAQELKVTFALLDSDGRVLVDTGASSSGFPVDTTWADNVAAVRRDLADETDVPLGLGSSARVLQLAVGKARYTSMVAGRDDANQLPQYVYDLLATNLACLLITQHRIGSVEGSLEDSEVFSRLLNADQQSIVRMAPLLRHLDLAEGQRGRLLVLSWRGCDGGVGPDVVTEEVQSAVESALTKFSLLAAGGRAVTTILGGNLAVLLSRAKGDDSLLAERLASFLDAPECSAMGMRALFSEELAVSEFPTARERLCNAAALAGNLGLTKVLGPAEIGTLVAFNRLAAHPPTLDALTSQLGVLVAYDAEHDSELVKTLTRYLVTGRGTKETADILHIHPSTLKYRVRRIQELLGVQLSDPEVRFDLALACRVFAARGD